MLRRLLLAVLLFSATATIAQTTDTSTNPKRYTHQFGLQINELFRQVFNFNGTAVNTNPYLFTYSINSARSGWGLRTGIGYSYQSATTDDGITRRTSELNNLNLRLGAEKLFMLSRKWTTGVGADLVVNHNDDYSKAMVRSFDTVTTVTKSKITAWGGGPMVWIRYHLTDHVLIGTEGSFYYSKGQEKGDVSITRRQFNPGTGGSQIVTNTSKVDNERISGTLSVPIAIFIIVRF